MERVESIKKQKGIFEILTSKKAKYVMGTILLSGLGVVLPRIFHVLAGSSAGATFLPMHLAVLIATFTLGTISGSIVAGTSIVLSYVLTGMPTLDRLPYMLIELLLYVILVGIFKKKFNFYISFIFTMILGRILYAGILWGAMHWMGLPTYGISVMESVKVGMPGILIQLLCVPFISTILKERLNLKND